ncbi:hypothetical protein Ddye_000996, partial [Dipteronia dyeriana]
SLVNTVEQEGKRGERLDKFWKRRALFLGSPKYRLKERNFVYSHELINKPTIIYMCYDLLLHGLFEHWMLIISSDLQLSFVA